jgi:hypothetical protein
MSVKYKADQRTTVEDLPALELRCDSLQELVSELLVKNEELRRRLVQFEAHTARESSAENSAMMRVV